MVSHEFPEICKECGGDQLRWHSQVKNTSGVVDGRLRSHEIRPIFVLGCDECSETLKVIDGDEAASIMTKLFYPHVTE